MRRSPSARARGPGGAPVSAVRGPLARSASSGTRPPTAFYMAPLTSAHSSIFEMPATRVGLPDVAELDGGAHKLDLVGVLDGSGRAKLRARVDES